MSSNKIINGGEEAGLEKVDKLEGKVEILEDVSKLKKVDHKKTFLLLIQGPTNVGKTFIADYIKNHLSNINKKVVLLKTDNYYKTFPYQKDTFEELDDNLITLTEKEYQEKAAVYDFDNPKALDWDAIKETLLSYGRRDDKVIKYSYSFNTRKLTSKLVDNYEKPDIIILEGLYSFNLFNKDIFNVKCFDCTSLPSAPISKEYVKNESLEELLSLFITPFKIHLFDEKDLLFERRCKRDFYSRNRISGASFEEFKIVYKKRFDELIWQSTLRWINKSPDNGEFNEIKEASKNLKECQNVIEKLFSSFGENEEPINNFLKVSDLKKSSDDLLYQNCI